MGDPAHVLCVCTANVCRSPAAELLIRAGLRARLGPGGRGRGAGQQRRAPGPPRTGRSSRAPRRALRRAGVDAAAVAGARSTRLTPEAVAGADLIIASTAEHVRAVWRLQLASRHKTFTLGELARLSEGVHGDDLPAGDAGARLRALVARTSALREQRHRPGMPYVTEAYDLEDPTDNDPAQRDMVEQTGRLGGFRPGHGGRTGSGPARLPG